MILFVRSLSSFMCASPSGEENITDWHSPVWRPAIADFRLRGSHAEPSRKREDTHMMDRRTFATLLAGSIAAPRLSWGQGAGAKVKTVFYSSVGGDLTLYSMDVDDASLVK